MSDAYNSSPEILALRSKLKASNQEISKVLGENRPKVNIESRLGYDRTDTINTSSIEKTQYNSPRSVTLDITQNIYDSGKKIKNLKSNRQPFLQTEQIYFRKNKLFCLKLLRLI